MNFTVVFLRVQALSVKIDRARLQLNAKKIGIGRQVVKKILMDCINKLSSEKQRLAVYWRFHINLEFVIKHEEKGSDSKIG